VEDSDGEVQSNGCMPSKGVFYRIRLMPVSVRNTVVLSNCMRMVVDTERYGNVIVLG